ncbi:hypothetical protein ACV3UV_12035 [Clostridium perfringens]
MKITKNDFAYLKEKIEFENLRIKDYEEIKYNYCPKYWGLKDYSTNPNRSCNQDIEDCFLCWEEKLTKKELRKYNKLKNIEVK